MAPNTFDLRYSSWGETPTRSARNEMYEEIRELAIEAKSVGLAVVVWSYPRGSSISQQGETAVDVVAYAAQIAAQLGAHLIKVKPPSDHIEQASSGDVVERSISRARSRN